MCLSNDACARRPQNCVDSAPICCDVDEAEPTAATGAGGSRCTAANYGVTELSNCKGLAWPVACGAAPINFQWMCKRDPAQASWYPGACSSTCVSEPLCCDMNSAIASTAAGMGGVRCTAGRPVLDNTAIANSGTLQQHPHPPAPLPPSHTHKHTKKAVPVPAGGAGVGTHADCAHLAYPAACPTRSCEAPPADGCPLSPAPQLLHAQPAHTCTSSRPPKSEGVLFLGRGQAGALRVRE